MLALVEAEEGRYQASLNDTYAEMGEKTFKGLRRALPMTRSKLDWDKVRREPMIVVCTLTCMWFANRCLGISLGRSSRIARLDSVRRRYPHIPRRRGVYTWE